MVVVRRRLLFRECLLDVVGAFVSLFVLGWDKEFEVDIDGNKVNHYSFLFFFFLFFWGGRVCFVLFCFCFLSFLFFTLSRFSTAVSKKRCRGAVSLFQM